MIVGCVGGGSNFAGLTFPFLRGTLRGENQIRYVAAEPAACPTLTRGVYAYDFGDTVGLTPLMPMHTLGHDFVPPPAARRRPALPRRRADDLRARQGGRDRGARLPPERDLRGRRAVRPHRGHHPRARVRARDPRGDRGGRWPPRRRARSARSCSASAATATSTSPPTTPTSAAPLRIRSSRRRICRRRSTRCRRARRPSHNEGGDPTCGRTSSSTPKARRSGGGCTSRTMRQGPAPTIVMCHGYSAVKELFLDAFAEVFCDAGFCGARLRQPQPRRVRRRAAAGDRPVGAGPRLPARDHLRAHARRGRRRPDRGLGLQLQRRARARRGRDRPAREVRRRAGAADQRPRERAPARPRGPDRADAGDVRRRPRGALSRRGADDDPGRRAGGRAVRAADRRLLRVVHDERRRSARRRGSTSARCAASRCSGSTSRARTCRGSHPRRC